MTTTRTGRRWLAAGASAVTIVALTMTGSGAASTSVAAPRNSATSKMAPAVGVSPHYVRVGHYGGVSRAIPTFSCQSDTAPVRCYGPAQIRAAYGINKVHATGAHRTIVIVDAFQSPTIRTDLAAFDSTFNLPAPRLRIVAPDGLTPFDPTDPDMAGWSSEITLDVEWAHAIAQKAKIVLVLAKSDEDSDILSATRYAVRHNLGDVISQSFGEAEQCMQPALLRAQHHLFYKAAKQHITVLAAAGDEGAAQPTCDFTSYFKAASTPASDPLVTGVGGTTLNANPLTGAYRGETVWNEPDYAVAGGGGYSVVYSRPGYQRGANRNPARGVPDVAYNAAINGGVLVAWTEPGTSDVGVWIFGGTSSGTPQWAGLVALADQLRGYRVGFLNPVLYGASRHPRAYHGLFHDITAGDNTYHGDVTVPGFAATRGWDAASGLGSPKANWLVPALAFLH